MRNDNAPSINGKFLYYAFLSGSRQIIINQAELNRINVYPVNDKDTGSNLASTVRSVIDSIRPDKSYKTTLNNIAVAALTGARGNSGAIFAQFLYGINNETKDYDQIGVREFTESITRSLPYIYEAVENPVEGTMLSVIREWSEFIDSKKEHTHEFHKLFSESVHILERSLEETTSKLKVLTKNCVVDAGAKGFVVFIKGILEFINHRNIRALHDQTSERLLLVHSSDLTYKEDIKYRYCTEALLKNLLTDKASLHSMLSVRGDSIVIAGSEKICRIHIHTDNPAELFSKLKEIGTITFQKADDMVRQQESTTNRKWNIALVTDSTCDLPPEIIEKYQIHQIPLNLMFGDNHYLDKVTIKPEQFFDMLENSVEVPKSSQINEMTFTNIFSQLASHYDAIIAIHLTRHFSGTFGNSVKAGERVHKESGKPIYVIDSKTLSGALGLLVLRAARLIEQGEKAEEIINKLNSDIPKTKILVSVKNLKYMIRGGRVSKPKGFIANLLGINPVITVNESGKSDLFGKTFSQQASLGKIYSYLEETGIGSRISEYIVLHAHNHKEADSVCVRMKSITGMDPISVVNISPIIGMHAGNGAVAISFIYN